MLIRNVAVIVSGMDEEYPYHIIRGINKVAIDNNINIFYFTAYGNIACNKKSDIGELSIYQVRRRDTYHQYVLGSRPSRVHNRQGQEGKYPYDHIREQGSRRILRYKHR